MVDTNFFSFETFEYLVLNKSWFAWGVLPYVGANVGFWTAVILLEIANKPGLFQKVTYGKRRRTSMLAEFHREKVSFRAQLLDGLLGVSGLPMILNDAFATLVFGSLFPPPETALPSWPTFVRDFVLLIILKDFFLYWAHRAAHTLEFLWKSHEVHHEITLTSAISTGRVGVLDKMVAGGGPVYLSGLIVQPHPVTYAVSIGAFLSDFVAVHSGLDSFYVDLVTLRFLPGRAPISLHDHHHHYSKYMGKAKNFGHVFWVWDWAFGTLAARTERKQLGETIDRDAKTE